MVKTGSAVSVHKSHHYFNTLFIYSSEPQVELSFHDWLLGLQHTVRGSIQQQPPKETEDEQADEGKASFC